MRSAGLMTAVVAAAGLVLAGCGGAPGSAQRGAQTMAAPSSSGGGGVASAAASPAGGGIQGQSSTAQVPAAPGAIIFHMKVAFTGAYTFTDSYDATFDPDDYVGSDGDPETAPKSCDDVAKLGTTGPQEGDPPGFQVPTPDGVMASGQNSLSFQAGVDSYAGPKTYTGSEIDSSAGLEISNTPTLPDDGGGDLNFGDAPSQSSLTVNADGSGTLKIVGWEDAGSRTLSGTVTWTCTAT